MQEISFIYNDHLLQAQEWSVPVSRKSSNNVRMPAWMNKLIPAKLKYKKELYRVWKQGQETWKEYKDIEHAETQLGKPKPIWS